MPLSRTRLRALRAEREWSQAKLAAQVGVTRQTINSIEKGRFHPQSASGLQNCPRLWEANRWKCLSTRIFEGLSARIGKLPQCYLNKVEVCSYNGL